MTDPARPNEQAPATRSEWLALIREAVRLEMATQRRFDPNSPTPDPARWAEIARDFRLSPQPPSEG